MARNLRNSTLETRSERLKLGRQPKPYWLRIGRGLWLGYRRLATSGTWNVRSAGATGQWIKQFATADDYAEADGADIIDFFEAQRRARIVARSENGHEHDANKPLTVAAALSYGELAAMMPRAGGQYVYLREALSPAWGFLYGWTLFLVIQTGTIAAVGIGFARYLEILWPPVSETSYLIPPIHISSNYAISLSMTRS